MQMLLIKIENTGFYMQWGEIWQVYSNWLSGPATSFHQGLNYSVPQTNINMIYLPVNFCKSQEEFLVWAQSPKSSLYPAGILIL